MDDAAPQLSLLGVTGHSRRVTIRYDLKVAAAAVAHSQLANITEVFLVCAGRGAFSVTGMMPAATDGAVTAIGKVRQEGSAVVFSVSSSVAIDVRAFQCVRNMARRLRRGGLEVVQIVVADPLGAATQPTFLEWPTEDTEEVAYPGFSRSAASLVHYEDSEFSKFRRYLIELGRRLRSAEVEQFQDWASAWYALLEAGAYAVPIEAPEENDVVAGSISQFDERTVEVVVNRFIASEQAWCPLTNMAVSFWGGAEAIRNITID